MIPPALQRPGIRWDNIKPVPFDVRKAGDIFIIDESGKTRPAITYEERTGPRTEVWWLVPHNRPQR